MRIKTIIMTIFFSLCMLIGGSVLLDQSLFLSAPKTQSADNPLIFSTAADFKFDGNEIIGLSDTADGKACTSRTFWIPSVETGETRTSENWLPFEVTIPSTSSDGKTVTTITPSRTLQKRVKKYVPLQGWKYETVIYVADCFGYGIQKVTIPVNIQVIGGGAFLDDINLSVVQINGNLLNKSKLVTIGSSAFSGCTSLTSFSNAASLVTIEDSAFSGCTSLTSFSFPMSLTTVGDSAFYQSGLKSFSPSSGSSYGNYMSAIKSIGEDAFQNTQLESFTFTSSIEEIGRYAFSNCSQLKTINFNFGMSTLSNPYKLKTIPEYMCYNCDSLAEINIPDSVTTIGDSAFMWCSKLASIVIPSTVTTFGKNIFADAPTVIIAANRDKYLEYTASTHNLSQYSGNITYPIRVIYKSDTSSSATTLATEAKLYKQDVCWYASSTTSSYWEKKESYSLRPGRWKTASGQIVDVDVLQNLINTNTGDITLYAVPYSIIFNANTGTGEMKAMNNILYTAKVTLSPNAFKKSGYLFKCWCVNANGSGDTYLDEAVVSGLTLENSITLYAQWEETWAAYAVQPKGGGSSADDPYLISSEQELAWISKQMDAEDGFPEKFFKLIKDIDLTGHNWLPIGDGNIRFAGTFFGNGFVIKNLTTSSNKNYSGDIIYSYTGLFGCTWEATLNDITLLGTVTGKEYVGGIVGYADYKSNIFGCRNFASVEGKQSVGGIAGHLDHNTTISLCTNFGDVTATAGNGGGIVGEIKQSKVISCYVENCQISNEDEKGAIGGVAGYMYESEVSSCILNKVTLPKSGSGYLAGALDDSSIVIKDCLVKGSTCNGDQLYFGGDFSQVDISSCVYNDCYISGEFENWCYFQDKSSSGELLDFLVPGKSSWLSTAMGGNAKTFIQNNYTYVELS